MGDSMLRHVKCGGGVFVNISPLLRFTTPAIALTPNGVVLPVLELQEKPKNSASPEWYCQECSKIFQDSELKKEVEVRCMICAEDNATEITYTSHQIAAICKSCKEVLTGNEKPTKDSQRKALEYLQLDSNIQFVKVSTVLLNVKF